MRDYHPVRDLYAHPEIRFLHRHYLAIVVGHGLALAGLGAGIGWAWPSTGASALQFTVWGVFLPIVGFFHATSAVNSVAHRWGSRPHATSDNSRNNAFIALLTGGEGWHDNHHHRPGAANMGRRWWQLDPTFAVLWVLERIGIVWGMRVAGD